MPSLTNILEFKVFTCIFQCNQNMRIGIRLTKKCNPRKHILKSSGIKEYLSPSLLYETNTDAVNTLLVTEM